jgi:LysR family hydrogen peroxide-inducible transcriptional activator
MTIIQLEYLLAVANYGSFSLASQHCFVTQPSLSMQIKNLEQELGVLLLDRSKKPVIPTEAGAVVIRNARETLKAYNFIRESVNDLKGEVSGVLRLGVIPTIAPYLMHLFIPAFMRRYPKVELQIREMMTSQIVESLGRDMLDAAIIAGGGTPKGIIEHELFNDRFYAYVSPQNPLYGRSNVRIEDISPRELLLLGDGHCLRDQVLELCQGRSRGSHGGGIECGSLETLMRIVDSTASMTVIPEMAAGFVPDARRRQLKTLAKGAVSRKIIVVVRRSYVKSSIIGALKESIMAVAQ